MRKFDLATRNAVLLSFSDAVSFMGDLLYLMAINTWVARVTSRPELLGLIAAAGSLALALGNPFGGLLADRFDKQRLLVAMDLLSAATVLVTYLLYSATAVPVAPLIMCNVVLALCFSVFSPTARAIGPLLGSGDGLRKMNALLSTTGETVRIVAPAAGALLMASSVIGERELILFNAASFALSALANLALRLRPEPAPRRPMDWQVLRGYREVWAQLGSSRVLLAPIGLVNMFSGGLSVLLPFLGKTVSPAHYPHLLLAQGVGAVIGSVLAGRWLGTLRQEHLWGLLVAAGVSLVGLHPAVPAALHYALMFAFGATIAVFNVNFFTAVQTQVPPAILGRTFGLVMTAAACLVPVGNAVFGWLAERALGAGIPAAGVGMLIAVAALALVLGPSKPREPAAATTFEG